MVPGTRIEGCSQVSISESNLLHEEQRPGTTVAQLLGCCRCPSNEFLTRFLLHILPQGFVRIRRFGFLANRRRTTLLPLCFQLLGSTPEPPAEEHPSSTEDATDLYRCPQWGGPMKVIERLTAAEIQLRSPPTVTVAA